MKNNKKELNPEDLYTFDYKTYMKEMYNLENIVMESPVLYPGTLHKFDHDLIFNSQMAIKIEKKGKNIGNFKIGNNVSLRIFKEIEGDLVYYNLLYPDQPIIAVSHTVREINGGVESLDIWQSIRTRGLARFWVFDFILKNYKFMMSDKIHTVRGKEFWKRLVDDSLNEKINVFVLNIKTKEKIPLTNFKEVDNYYGSNAFEYRFVIEK